MSISRKQIALIHVAKNQLELSERDYRTILRHIGEAETSKELDTVGFELVMQYMIALGFKADWTKDFYGHRPGMATPAQINLIRALWGEYTDGDGTDITLGKWLDKTFSISAIRFVDTKRAPKIITALKAMKKKAQNRKAAKKAQDGQ
jgi:hypothetical protein